MQNSGKKQHKEPVDWFLKPAPLGKHDLSSRHRCHRSFPVTIFIQPSSQFLPSCNWLQWHTAWYAGQWTNEVIIPQNTIISESSFIQYMLMGHCTSAGPVLKTMILVQHYYRLRHVEQRSTVKSAWPAQKVLNILDNSMQNYSCN